MRFECDGEILLCLRIETAFRSECCCFVNATLGKYDLHVCFGFG